MSEEHPILTALREGQQVRERTLAALIPAIGQAAASLVDALKNGRKVLVFGNGGSAAEAQHFSGELTGRYRAERVPLPAIALTTDTSALTCIGNDYRYEDVFARQVVALAQPGDVVVGITTSGRSANVVRGLEAALERGAVTIALTGEAGLQGLEANVVLAVPSSSTARVQEEHLAIIHCWCDAIDAAFVSTE
ncbi:MAG: SIS domain-containing protein [bacterium]|nr:SIS domain-containing protein [bacterium]